MINAIGIDAPGAPRLRLVPRLRHPVQRRHEQERAQGATSRSTTPTSRTASATRCPRTRNQEASGDAAHPDRRQRRLQALRAVRRARQRRRAGRPARAPSGTCAPTTCARTAGRRPTRPACRSCPGLVRYDEVAGGRDPPRAALHRLAHDARRTSTRRATTPATADPRLPPMGLRVRLKASVDISQLRQAGARRRCRRSRPTG